MIDNRDISVVVQGPVQALADRPMDEGITYRSLKSVRQYLPGAHIILSTWHEQNLDGLDFDELVLCDDPGPNIYRYLADGEPGKLNNNRQIVSSREGLKRVKTRYAMKLRSDNFLVGDQFKALQQRFDKRHPEYAFLQQRVVVNNTFTREYAKGMPVVFHACDFFYFGLTEDLLALWDLPLFEDYPFDPEKLGKVQGLGSPYFPPDCTQKFWLAALQRFDDSIRIDHLHHCNPELKRTSDLCYANNLVVGEPAVIGLGLNSKFSGDERANRLSGTITYLSHLGWQRLYRKYCDPDWRIEGNLADWLRQTSLRAVLLPGKWVEGQLRLRKWVAKNR
ncbi:WavE lipopolysaccharide synthesis family protein [Motiliproteus sediminis]|uniref:WavE lipopolysaccharide synthesis family protein n=1 Tax=Motiliproteus sediminis TaxID=1468178 RepID=UPI001AEF749E|nr:WavE lipopolysaccharide synthesis family protein [Motiliproteus sediminis]